MGLFSDHCTSRLTPLRAGRARGLAPRCACGGARRPRVASRSHAKEPDPHTLVDQLKERWFIVVAALIVLGISFVLLRGCIESANKVSEQVGQPPQQTQTSAEGSVTYQGTVFSISKQDDGTYALVGRREKNLIISVEVIGILSPQYYYT